MKELNTVLTMVNNGIVKFPIKENSAFLQTPVSCLDLDNRSSNALARNGIKTVEDILHNLDRLTRFKNFGTKSLSRTMYALCAHQYSLLAPEQKKTYLERIIELNTCPDNQ